MSENCEQMSLDMKMREVQIQILKSDWEIRFVLIGLFLVSVGLSILQESYGFMNAFFAFLIGGKILSYLSRSII